jgi:hypothetical protein
MHTKVRHLISCSAAAATLLLSWSAHAANPIADEKIAVAQASLQRAEQSATALAEQANVDAEVAEATATEQRSHAAAVEFDTSMQALRNEAMRSTSTALPVQ